MSIFTWGVLFSTGLAAGFVDAIAGGGGIITLPVLLNVGLPPQLALGTNKLQATFGSGSATWHYGQAGLIDFRSCKLGVLCTFVGAAVGSIGVTQLDPLLLRQAIPWLIIAVALYLLFQPKAGAEDTPARMSQPSFHLLFGLGVGFYDGFFGPGTGTFWAMAYVLFLGFNLRRATAHTKAMNLTSNLASLLVFAVAGQIQVGAGLSMGIGQVLGARLGSRVVIRRGIGWLRPIFIAVSLAITVRLFWQNRH